MNGFVNSVLYKVIVVFIIMPLIGIIIQSGDVIFGLILLAMQLPWFLKTCCNIDIFKNIG